MKVSRDFTEFILKTLENEGVPDCAPEIPSNLEDLASKFAISALKDAQVFAGNNGRLLPNLDDIRLALVLSETTNWVTPLPVKKLKIYAKRTNGYRLPPNNKIACGLKLPSEALTLCNYVLQKRLLNYGEL